MIWHIEQTVLGGDVSQYMVIIAISLINDLLTSKP